MAGYRRARSAEQKAERMEQIMEAAERLFEAGSYHGITLATIAAELGWSRGNLYNYVQTKEEVFLAIYRRENLAYVADLVKSIPDPDSMDAAAFARAYAEATDRHHGYLRYQGILTTILETNVPVDKLAAFKRQLVEDVAPAIGLVDAWLPEGSRMPAADVHLAIVRQAACMHDHLCGTPLQMKAMEIAGLPLPKEGFAGSLATFVEVLLRGCCADSDRVAHVDELETR